MKTPFQKEERSHLHNSLPSQGHTCLIRDRIEQHEKKERDRIKCITFLFLFFEEFARKIADSGVVKKCTYHTIPFMTLDYSSEMQKFYLFFFSRLYEVCCCTTLSKILNNVVLAQTVLLYVFAATFACCAKYRRAVKFGYKRGFNYVDKARSPIRNDFPFPCDDKTNFHDEKECIDRCIFRLSRSLKMFQPLKWRTKL